MKNTDTLNQAMLDKANLYRKEQYEKIRSMIRRLTVIDANVRLLLRQLESDPDYRFGDIPITDAGPFIPDDVPAYTPPSGCDNCVYRDFGPAT